MLRFLIDHNVPNGVCGYLRRMRYDIKLVRDVDPEMTDVQVLKLAKQDRRVLVSNDKDFLALSMHHNQVDMVLFNYLNQSAEIRIAGLKQILEKLHGGFGVVVLQ